MHNQDSHGSLGYMIDPQVDAVYVNINGGEVLIHPDVLVQLVRDLAQAAAIYRIPGHQWNAMSLEEKEKAFALRLAAHSSGRRSSMPAQRQTVGLGHTYPRTKPVAEGQILPLNTWERDI